MGRFFNFILGCSLVITLKLLNKESKEFIFNSLKERFENGNIL